jgi:hypothetical protein
MQTAAPSPADEPLYNLLGGPAPPTIPDVIARMEAIDALLPVTDGLKWFNRLYLMVTQQVDLCPPRRRVAEPVLARPPRCRLCQLLFRRCRRLSERRLCPLGMERTV